VSSDAGTLALLLPPPPLLLMMMMRIANLLIKN